ncbi:hypothetical protein T484DRAFT_1836018, partial [Baffinella frigidus]
GITTLLRALVTLGVAPSVALMTGMEARATAVADAFSTVHAHSLLAALEILRGAPDPALRAALLRDDVPEVA